MRNLLLLLALAMGQQNLFAQGWTELGGLNALAPNGAITLITIDNQDNVYVSGNFTNGSGKHYIAKWNGTAWSRVDSGLTTKSTAFGFSAMAADRSGNFYVAGNLVNGSNKYYVAKWNGSTWTEVGSGANALNANGDIFEIAVDTVGNIYAGGDFKDGSNKHYVAKWNGITWGELGTIPFPNYKYLGFKMTVDADNNLYCSEMDTNALNADIKQNVAKWNGSTWSILGSGINALNGDGLIQGIATDASGNVFTAGELRDTAGIWYVTKWNGSNWSTMGTGVNALNAGLQSSSIYTIETDANGSVYVAGNFKNNTLHAYVAKWNGTNWTEVGGGSGALNAGGEIIRIRAGNDGALYAVGAFRNASSNYYVAKWGGSTAVGQPLSLDRMEVYPNPGTGVFTIRLNEDQQNVTARITDVAGKTVFEKVDISGNTFNPDISAQPDGIYFLDIISGENVLKATLVKRSK